MSLLGAVVTKGMAVVRRSGAVLTKKCEEAFNKVLLSNMIRGDKILALKKLYRQLYSTIVPFHPNLEVVRSSGGEVKSMVKMIDRWIVMRRESFGVHGTNEKKVYLDVEHYIAMIDKPLEPMLHKLGVYSMMEFKGSSLRGKA
jgi:hypothetical protein